jgi:hypothetical protein
MATAQLNSEALAITPIDLLRQAITQGVSIDQLERLQAMHERWEANEARKAYRAAMNAFKAEAPTILKNKYVKIEPRDSSKRTAEYDHATLDHVCDAVIGLLAKHGLSHDWKKEQNGEWIKVTCILTHEGGHSEERSLMGVADNSGFKNSIQRLLPRSPKILTTNKTLTRLIAESACTASALAVIGFVAYGRQGWTSRLRLFLRCMGAATPAGGRKGGRAVRRLRPTSKLHQG